MPPFEREQEQMLARRQAAPPHDLV